MKSMNINSYFFYDAYNEATDPFPEGVDSFVQKWNTWSHTQVDTKAVKELVDQVHKSGAVAMLYNMISADSNPKNPALPLAALAYMLFVQIYFPCIATLAAIKQESGSWKWALFAAGYTTVLAWCIAFVVYQLGNLII